MQPDLHPEAPDPDALRRRVLLAALVTLVSFFGLGYLVTAIGGPPWLLLPALLIVLVGLLPVAALIRLSRRMSL